VLTLDENAMQDISDVVDLPEVKAVHEAEVWGSAPPKDSQKSLHCSELPHLLRSFGVIRLVHSFLPRVVRHSHHINIQVS
jgi:hypothetical protein